MKKTPIIMISILLFVSLVGNVLQYRYLNSNIDRLNIPNTIEFTNANSRDTYFTIHNIAEAHKISRGKGIKVGIIDWCFGSNDNKDLYHDVVEITDYSGNLVNGHGKWMATVLKEIAPECEIYALAVGIEQHPNIGIDEGKLLDAIIAAITWSVENDLDILTLSLQPFSETNQARLDEAVDMAVGQGVVTTFLHNSSVNNLLPFGLIDYDEDFFTYDRKPDINVFQYDYNAVQLNYYMNYLEFGPARSYDDVKNGYYIPFFSNSSMSPVTAGFVAILKSINNTLSPAEYKEILVKTSYFTHFNGGFADFEDTDATHVVDIGKAVKYLQENYK